MKRHLCSVLFTLPDNSCYIFVGFVTSTVIDPSKLFLEAFGFELPAFSHVELG